MLIRRLCSIAAVFCAAVFLSGCYVLSSVAPKADAFDTRLAGFWAGLDEGKPTPGTFLQFVEGTEKKEPRLVLTSPKGVAVYDLRTVRNGKGGAFAIKVIMTDDKDDAPSGYILGFYEVRGRDLWMTILDSDKVGALVDAGKVKGTKGEGKYFDVTLTGTPEEVAQFLASPEARAAVSADGKGTVIGRRRSFPR